MMKKYTVEIQRSWIVMANAMIKSVKHPAAAMLGKVTKRIDAFLEEHPGETYRITAECIDDEKPASRTDREAEEEQHDPMYGHHR